MLHDDANGEVWINCSLKLCSHFPMYIMYFFYSQGQTLQPETRVNLFFSPPPPPPVLMSWANVWQKSVSFLLKSGKVLNFDKRTLYSRRKARAYHSVASMFLFRTHFWNQDFESNFCATVRLESNGARMALDTWLLSGLSSKIKRVYGGFIIFFNVLRLSSSFI